MTFQHDHPTEIVEWLGGETAERSEEERAETDVESVAALDQSLAGRYRVQPGVLRSTLDPKALDTDSSDSFEPAFILRTRLGTHLQSSGLSEATQLFVARSLLAGIQSMDRPDEELPDPSVLMARLLRQDRLSRRLEPLEIAEGWRVVFETQAERGNWAEAEDALFHALELAEYPENLLRRGLSFFDELVDHDERQLQRGGLSPEEVDRARWELLELLDEQLEDVELDE